MNYLDAILLLPVLVMAIIGYRMGFIKSLLGLIGLGGPLVMALLGLPQMAQWLDRYFAVAPQWLNPLAFALLWAVGLLVCYAMAQWSRRKVPQRIHVNVANKWLGMLPGLAMGCLFALLMAKIATSSTVPQVAKQVNSSFFANTGQTQMDWTAAQFADVFTTAVTEKISGAYHDSTTVTNTESFKSSEYVARPDLEKAMLQLVNAERAKVGAKPLKFDPKMKEVAYWHAADMFVRGYFSHNTPEGTDPFMRMKKMGIQYKTAGENLAHASSLSQAHQGLMDSPGHKANILKPTYGRIGIAVLDAGSKGLLFVQEFRD